MAVLESPPGPITPQVGLLHDHTSFSRGGGGGGIWGCGHGGSAYI